MNLYCDYFSNQKQTNFTCSKPLVTGSLLHIIRRRDSVPMSKLNTLILVSQKKLAQPTAIILHLGTVPTYSENGDWSHSRVNVSVTNAYVNIQCCLQSKYGNAKYSNMTCQANALTTVLARSLFERSENWVRPMLWQNMTQKLYSVRQKYMFSTRTSTLISHACAFGQSAC